MNKQDLRYAYLNYCRNQYAHNEPIESKTLIEMAPNGKIANEVIRELVAEELIEGIDFVDGDEKGLSLVTDKVVKLTEKGKNEISKMNLAQRLAEDTKKEEQNEKLIQTLIERERERISKLSDIAKEEEIKIRILKHFDYLNSQIDKYENKQIKVKELKENLKQLVSHYFDRAPQIYAKKITTDLVNEGYITYLYQKDSSGSVDIDKLLTNKAKSYIVQLEKENNERLEQYCKEHNIKFPKINIPTGIIQAYKSLNNPTLIAAMNQLPAIQKILSNPGLLDAMNNINYPAMENAIKAANAYYSNISTNINKEDKNNSNTDKDNETYTFEGILGYNCGEVVTPTSIDSKRIQERGFKVKDGISVLRGFALASDLANCSRADKNYQRDKNLKHINLLVDFMDKMKISAKYLPEVTLVARGYEKLEPIQLSGKLTETQKGELDNLEYYKLIVTKEQLFRIDGNHRLEAIKESNYYIPFSIIVWDKSSISEDDEAFLFYFLNSKSKKLTSEENLKGLVNAKTWKEHELKTANTILPYIKHFKDNFEGHSLFNKEYYKNSQGSENAKTQILNVLELILKELNVEDLPFDKVTFGNYITSLQEILSQRDRFKYLRANFRCFPQFVFYTLYKNDGDTESSIKFINEVDKWAEFYKHDFNSFIQPNKMYHNAVKQLKRQINIFVAMPYYDETTVAQFNKTFESLINEIKEENEIFEDKVNLYPIMTYKAESTDILANMNKQIGECDIFIADISNHGKSKVNPNVMFELGRVYDSKKFILIRNKDNKVTNSAFDIQHIDYVPIDFGMGFDTSMKTNLKPRIVNLLKSIIGFC